MKFSTVAACVIASAIVLAATEAWAASPSWKIAPNFQVQVTLSSKAAAALAKANETIIVVAYFYGLANWNGKFLQDQMGQIYVAPSQQVELRRQGIASFTGPRYDANLLKYMAHNYFEVLINVFSGRRTSKDNLLGCTIFEDSISVAVRGPIKIHCALLDEMYGPH